jgi:hypothetical protein
MVNTPLVILYPGLLAEMQQRSQTFTPVNVKK